MGAKVDKRNKKQLNKTKPESIPTGVYVVPFEQHELDKIPAEVLEALGAADNSTAHLTDPYHNVDPAKMISVINVTFKEIEQRIPGIPHTEFGRWKELQR